MDSVSMFDGLNQRARDLYGRDTWDLDRDELRALYGAHGILPRARPNLTVVRDTPKP